MKIIKMPVSELSPAALRVYIEALLAKLTAQATIFATPPAALATSLAVLVGLLNDLDNLEAQVTAKLLVIAGAAGTVRNNANALGDWAEGVTTDAAKLALVFDLRSARTASGPTPRVENVKLSRGDSAGEVDSGWDSLAEAGVKSYEVQTVLNPLNNDPSTGPWVQQPSVTKSKCTLGGFTSGSRVWQRVRGIGPAGPGDWSDPATVIVP